MELVATSVLTSICLNHLWSTVRPRNPARRFLFSTSSALSMSHLLSIWISKWCSGEEGNLKFNIRRGSFKGGRGEEERGMSSIWEVSPKMVIVAIIWYFSHPQQGGSPSVTASLRKPWLHGKLETLRRLRWFHGNLSFLQALASLIVSLHKILNSNWKGAETLWTTSLRKVLPYYPSWRRGGIARLQSTFKTGRRWSLVPGDGCF